MGNLRCGLERDMAGGSRGVEGGPRFEQVHGVKPVATRPKRIQARTFSLEELVERAHIPTLCTRQGHPASAHPGPLACAPTREEVTTNLGRQAGTDSPQMTPRDISLVSLDLMGLPKMPE